MKRILSALLLILASGTFSAYAQNSISLVGFGEIPYVKNSNDFTVTFKEYGSFDFMGTVQPLSLETTVRIDQLKKIPGYKILKELELVDATLKLSPDGFELEAKADTKKKLKTLCDALKIEEPYILVGAQIGPSGFKLSGDLDFTEKPIIIDVNKDLGTRMTLEKMSLGAEVGAGTNTKAILLVKNEIRLRPSGYDPDLRTVLELSFNLTSLDLTGSCSMTDEWQDPLGISHYIGTKKTDIIVGNTAVELGWKIGAPTPTNLGFAAGRAKFFDIDFGAAMSISPGSGQIALKAYSKRITMKQFENTLRNGFGLNIPDVFPASNNVYVDDANILFAPNGGKIGEFEIEQGFAFKGGLQFAGMMEGSVDFFANLDDGFYFDMYMNAEKMYQLLEREVKKESNPQNRKALEMALDNLQIRKIHLHMEADKSLNMSGAAKAKLRLFGNNVSFDLHGTFSPEKIVDQLIENIGKKALAQVEQVGKEVVKVAGAAANASINTAKAGYDKLGYYAEHSTTWWDHKSHGNSCMTKCVPNRAEKLSGPVYESSNQAIKDFYDKVIPKAAKIEGRYHREKYIKADWDRLTSSIDNNWENIIRDDLYKGFDKDKSDVEKLGKKYRKLVREKKQQHINYRNKIWEKLMTKKPQVEYKYVWSKKMPELLGVTQLIPVETPTDKSFVLAVNSNKGIIDVYKVNADGSISVKVSSKAIKKGTWAVTSYDLYNRNYIFVSHSI